MAAGERESSWLDLQRQRDERLRFEVLRMLYDATGGDPECEKNAWGFALELGIWHAELFRVIDWLSHHGYVRYCGPGPTVCITPDGIVYLRTERHRRRSIREEPL